MGAESGGPGKTPGGRGPADDARKLVSKSQSDGSITSDASEVASHAKSGAQLGSKVAGGQGAAVGAAVGTGAALVKNKSARRRVALLIAVPLLIMGLLIGAVVNSVAGSQSERLAAIEQSSAAVAQKDGLSEDDVAAYRAAAESSGVQWQLLAAVDRAAGNWAKAGDPPYGIDDLTAFNKELDKYGIEHLSKAEAKDRVRAGYIYGQLIAAELQHKNPDVDPAQVDAGAVLMVDPDNSDRTIRGIDKDDADSTRAHDNAKNAFTAALAAIPAAAADDKDQIFDTAFRWTTGQQQEQQSSAGVCSPAGQAGGAVADLSITPRKDLPAVEGLNSEQVKNAGIIIDTGKALKLPANAWKIALMAALVESEIQNLDHGDRDSVGMYQMRPSTGWGTVEELTDPVKATQAFFGKATFTDNPGVIDIKGWEQKPLGDVAQAVEASANPTAYAAEEQTATQVIKSLANVDTSDSDPSGFDDPGCSGSDSGGSGLVEAAIAAAKSTTGTPYSFGGGTYTGPTIGLTSPAGWDCSSLMQYSWYQASKGKIKLPRITTDQVNSTLLRQVEEPQRGDLIFIKTDGATWSHVVMFLGDGKIIEEPHTGAVSRVMPLDEYSGMAQIVFRVKAAEAAAANKTTDDGAAPVRAGKWTLPTKQNFQLGPGVCTAGTVCWGYSSHTGQDISINENAPIEAVAAGTVSTAKVLCPMLSNVGRAGNANCSYGRFVVIDHGNGVQTYYAHLNKFGAGIKVGTKVAAGQVVGYEGEQGHAYGPHLHIEVRKDGAIVNPIDYLEKQGVPIRCSPHMTGLYGSEHPPAGEC